MAESSSSSTPSLPPTSPGRQRLLSLLSSTDDLLQCLAGFLLLVMAAVLLFQAARLVPEMLSPEHYQNAILMAIHDVLLVMIVLELLWTVLTYLREHSVPLEPFLFVGIISSIRKLLLIGAQMSIEHAEPAVIDLQLREMATHGALVFVLIVGLVLVRWSRRWRTKDDLRIAK